MKKRADEARRGPLRCAIYTRKSNDEGLEQEFNSLHAQREACEAYVRSQAGEGWRLLPSHYDDGGFSGGNMDRPALTKLLADVDAGNVDIIVVYKVDRLTRSLMDFAKIVERLDARSVSFVSVTQAFNTTTSMGRLTLNVLLSFAQFEREVTAERIRDKIAASKAKGMWMGGNVPLGYDVVDRKMVPNAAEAKLVRHIYERYVALQSVPELVAELDRAGIRSKCWTSRQGNRIGGVKLRPGAVCYILHNPLYLGEVVHNGQSFPGNHDGIIDQDLFDQVQEIFARHRHVRHARLTRAAECPLIGLVYDSDGQLMSPTFGYGRGKKVYRYYASGPGQESPLAALTRSVRRVSASELEKLVWDRLATFLGHESAPEWSVVLPLIARIEVQRRGFTLHLKRAGGWRDYDPDYVSEVMQPNGILVDGNCVRIDVDCEWTNGPVRSTKGQFTSKADHTAKDDAVSSLLRTSHKRLIEHCLSPLDSESHPRGTAPPDKRSRRILTLGLMAPDVQAAFLDGKLKPTYSTKQLLDRDFPLAWSDQRAVLAA